MEVSHVPALAWVAFAGAFICVSAMFACLYVLTRRLGISWKRHPMGASVANADASNLGKLIFGQQKPPAGARVEGLLWAIRGLWIADALLVLTFAALVAGVI